MISKALERIKHDDRHLEVMLHIAKSVPERMFGEGAMLHYPEAPWITSQEAIVDGDVEFATAEEISAFFMRLRGAGSVPEVD